MGQIEEEDRPFMIFDNDTGKIFDTRIDRHVEVATHNPSFSLPNDSLYNSSNKSNKISNKHKSMKKDLKTSSSRASVWGDWWEE